MDSFFLFFRLPLSDDALREAILAFDFGCTILEPNYITASLGDARVWISLLNQKAIKGEISAECDKPIIPEGTLTIASIEVRRNENSDVFAILLAERLILKYQGSVDWNDISHWKNLYEGLQQWRKERPERAVQLPISDGGIETEG